MQGMGVMGLAFALLGAATFARLERLTKELKPKGILDEDNKEERLQVCIRHEPIARDG